MKMFKLHSSSVYLIVSVMCLLQVDAAHKPQQSQWVIQSNIASVSGKRVATECFKSNLSVLHGLQLQVTPLY